VDALEAKAAALKAETTELAKQYEQVEATLGDYDHLEELVGGGADISFYKKNVQAIVEKLKKLKADIAALIANVQAIDEEYQTLKKKVKAAQKQYVPAEEEYKAAKKAVEGERNAYQAQLNEAAKSLDENVLSRYLTKRKEGTPFPIVAELVSGRCPVCGMEPPIAAQGKLAAGIECDSCHRIIFKE
jgi:predicted  nucleic acid-binding Zn-ribbon protein